MPYDQFVTISGSDLKPGMQLYKSPGDKKPETLKAVTGSCEKGTHFGSNCYDRIGTWYQRIHITLSGT